MFTLGHGIGNLIEQKYTNIQNQMKEARQEDNVRYMRSLETALVPFDKSKSRAATVSYAKDLFSFEAVKQKIVETKDKFKRWVKFDS